MNIEEVREYCLGKEHAFETTPFDELTLVYKVGTEAEAKIFAMLTMDKPDYLLLKCDPDLAVELREKYPEAVEPGYHCNKRHWNGVFIESGGLPNNRIREMIDHSYDLVARSLTKRTRTALGF